MQSEVYTVVYIHPAEEFRRSLRDNFKSNICRDSAY